MAPKIARNFWDEKTKGDYDKDSLHPLIKSFGYDFGDLETEGFEKVCQLLEFQGWKFFCSVNFCKYSKGVDAELVRLFYANFKFLSSKKLIKTLVKGIDFTFNSTILEEYIANLCCFENIKICDNSVLYLSHGCDETVIEGYDPKISYKELLAPEFYEISKPTTSHLTRDNRLLAHILCHTIIPHEGSLTSLSNFTLALMFCINHKIRIHLPTLIISHMVHAKKISNFCYPYGMLITSFSHEFASVPLANILDKSFQKYDKSRLKNVFSFDKELDKWVFSPKSNKRPRFSDSVSQNPSSSRPSSSSNKNQTSLESDPSMNSISKWQEEFFDKFDDRMKKMEKFVENKVETLDDRVCAIEVRLRTHLNEQTHRMDKTNEMFQAFGECLKLTHNAIVNQDPFARFNRH